MVTNLHGVKEQSRVLTLDELCEYAAYSKPHIYRLLQQGKIPGGHKPGNGKWFFDREVINNWLLGKDVIQHEEKSATV